MGLSLTPADFKEQNLRKEDFKGLEKKGPMLNKKTSENQAAQTAILAGEGVEGYQQEKPIVTHPETRMQTIQKHMQIRDALWQDAQSTIGDILADPEVPDQTKLLIFEQTRDEKIAAGIKSTMDMLAEQASVQDTGPDATDLSEQSVDLAQRTIQRVNQHKREMQSLVNGVKSRLDPGTLATLGDVGELITPFAEWVHFSDLQRHVLNETGDEDRSILLGNQKRKVFEAIQGMTIEERAKVSEALADIIESNDQVIFSDGNDLLTIETLQQMMVDNDYSNFERWFDNATSILDVVGAGALLRSVSKGGKGAKAATATDNLDDLPIFEAEDVADADRFVSEAEKARRARRQGATATASDSTELIVPSRELTTKEAVDVEANVINEVVITDVAPASPARVTGDVNPNTARGMHETAMKSDDEAAEALYGTNKAEAAADDLTGRPPAGDEAVGSRPEMNPPRAGEPEHVRRIRLANGNTLLSDEEWAKVAGKLMGRFQDVGGMWYHAGSMAMRYGEDGTIGLTARYSPVDSGVSTAEEAIQNALFAFRNYPIDERNLKLLTKDGRGRWVEESAQDAASRKALVDGGAEELRQEYAVGLNYDYKFRPEDMEMEELLTTGGGLISRAVQFTDRMPNGWAGQGSLVQNLLDPASVIHPRIVNAASVAVDKAFRMRHLYIEVFGEFTDKYKKLPKERRAMMGEYINQANFESIPFSEMDLINRGFTPEEIETLKEWRLANDVMWYAANEDLVKSLRSKGYTVLEHKDSDTRLVGRKVNGGVRSSSVPKNEKAYDPVAETNRPINDELGADIGDAGVLVELREPIKIDGEWINYAVSRETPSGGYLREMLDDETVLSYREGYYPVMYDANFFVDKIITTAGGTKSRKTIATARSSKEVETLKRQIMASEGLTEAEYNAAYVSRKDRAVGQDTGLLDEGSFSVSSNSNLSMQRVRGERLADAGVDLHLRGMSNLKDPLEAVAEQIRTMSRRVATRDYIESARTRWMQSYEEYVDLPVNPVTRKPEWPTSVTQIKGKEGAPKRMVQDAKTNFNYLYSFENGYINGIDEAYKGGLHLMADLMSDIGFEFGEKALLGAAKASPTHAAKSVAFDLLLSANPARQALIQRSQMSQLMIYNPSYTSTKLLPELTSVWTARASNGKSGNVELLQEIKDLGILQAVDSHTLIRDDFLKLADLTAAQKIGAAAKKPIETARLIGFDWAEQDVMASAYLAFRDLAIKQGKNIKDVRVREQVLGQARAAMLNMNRSGDLAHGHNTLGPITQFLSFQHKAFLQGITNRNLTAKQKATLLAYNTALFGVTATPLYLAYDRIWGSSEPNPAKDYLKAGMLDITLNSTLSALSGDNVEISIADLAPINAYGIADVMTTLAGTPLSGMLAETPAGSLMFGSNPRLQDAARTAMRFFVPFTDYENEMLKTEAMDVVRAAGATMSGYSTFFRARYAFETGKALNGRGKVADSDVNMMEALALGFGLPTKTMKAQWDIYADSGKGSQRFFKDEDVEMWYGELKRFLNRKGMNNPEDIALNQAILGEAWRVFGQDRPRTMEIVKSLINRDAQAGDLSVLRGLTNQMGLITDEDWWKKLNKFPNSEIRDQLIQLKKEQEAGLQELLQTIEESK